MADFKYEVKEVVGVISKGKSSTKELRLISWNDKDAKYDIRDWWTDKDGNEKMGKGITLTTDEAKELVKLLKKVK